jgi:hypothetical protein
LKRGALRAVANNFNVNSDAISNIWKRARQSYEDPAIGGIRNMTVMLFEQLFC